MPTTVLTIRMISVVYGSAGATADFDLPPEIGRLASVDEAIEHMHKARDAGLITVIGKFKPDALVMGVGNEHKRFMTVCSCCSCCCMVRVMHNGKPEFKGLIRRLHGLAMRVRQGCVRRLRRVRRSVPVRAYFTDRRQAVLQRRVQGLWFLCPGLPQQGSKRQDRGSLFHRRGHITDQWRCRCHLI